MKLKIDFETRSTVDLAKAGPWRYAEDPTTDILCLAIKVDNSRPAIWAPPFLWSRLDKSWTTRFDIILYNDGVETLINRADTIGAHNVEFERALWHHIMHKRYGFPDLDLNKCDCTASRAAVMALPRKLEKACEVLKVSVKKDMAGHRLMLKMCKPRTPRKAEKEANPNWQNTVYWHENPEDFIRLFEYCIQDVEAEHALSKVLRPLSAGERQVWLADQRANERGLYVDMPNIRNIMGTLDKHEKALLSKVPGLTGGAVDSPRQAVKLRDWMLSQGVETENLQKATVEELLKTVLPSDVAEVLEIRQALSKASTSKFAAMAKRVSSDGRCKSLLMHHGASTGRATGKAIQPTNMVRDSYSGETLEQAYQAFEVGDIEAISILFDDPFPTASRCLRGSICAAPDNDFLCADYLSIEARGNAWQAGQESVLEAFRDGQNLYKMAAADTFGVPVDEIQKGSSEYQIGKVQILALGYQGGIGAFSAMTTTYGIDLETLPPLVLQHATEEELIGPYGAKALAASYVKKNPDSMSFDAAVSCDVIKRKWRAKNARVVASWKGLELAAFDAVAYPGQAFAYNKVKYRTWRDPNRNNYLLCQLPSGRLLFYFDPQIRNVKTSWDERKESVTCYSVDSVTKQWFRRPVYGGLLCENITQALCRDIMTHAQLKVEAAGYPVVLHVYDELVAEVPEGFGSLEEFSRLMEIAPTWAAGMPIKAEGWRGKRYRK